MANGKAGEEAECLTYQRDLLNQPYGEWNGWHSTCFAAGFQCNARS
ncbi:MULTISPECIES: hypothetical protein [Gammaproteobacteria]|nr:MULTISPECIES: hypothetical protein [Gammaproteobacteria]MBO9482127.1 hypothetical protein [Salinisphaera sp. G21_0]MBO9494643.1 hypothetical protein [Thalassotalea sp. G20_0]